MSDLGNAPEVTDDAVQPTDAVAADVEATEATPQAEEIEHEEFVIEGDGDQDQKPEDKEVEELKKRQAAFAERKRKQKEAEEAAQREKKRADELEERLRRLESGVGDMQRGPRPNPDDFYGDAEGFYKALDEWNGKSSSAPESNPAAKAPEYTPDYQAEFALEEGSEKLKSGGISDFDEKVSLVKDTISKIAPGANASAVFNDLMSIAVNGGVDPAKAAYMIGRNPEAILRELDSVKAPNEASRVFQFKTIMEREANKLKTRKKNSVDTQPEPSVRQGSVKRTDALAEFGHFEN